MNAPRRGDDAAGPAPGPVLEQGFGGHLPALDGALAALVRAPKDPFAWGFFTRMLFSALVDADRLATEEWSNRREGTKGERGWPGSLATLKAALDNHLSEAFDRLGSSDNGDGQAATDAADKAVKAQRQLERVYRRGMSSLLDVSDLREVMGRRELYRRFARIGDDVTEVAERVWYAAVKEA